MRLVRLLFLAIGVLSLSGCGSYEEVRYRMTVEVDTPQGSISGSSVIEVSGRTRPAWFPGSPGGSTSGFRGEAVTVEMPNGELMFALLYSENNQMDAGDFLGIAFEERLKKEYERRISANDTPGFVETLEKMKSWDGAIEVLPLIDKNGRAFVNNKWVAGVSSYPIMVRFDDIENPKSIKEVDPGNLAEIYGKGIALKRITITITNDAVTDGIEAKLNWLSGYYNRQFNGNRYQDFQSKQEGPAAFMSSGYFSTEITPNTNKVSK